MHPLTICLKVAKRSRRILESLCPNSMFRYAPLPKSANDIFQTLNYLSPFIPDGQFPSGLSKDMINLIVSNCDTTCKHQFDLLGSGPFTFSCGIDWHKDFKSGFNWPPQLLHTKVRSRTISGAEIKVPWELSRFYHSIPLSLALKFTGDKKYSGELIQQISNWIDNNRTGFGVNWACPMEAAIRSINWIVSLALLTDQNPDLLNDEFRMKVTNSLWSHGNFLRTHLEWNGRFADSGANHLLFNFAGLFSLGILFRKTSRGRRWLRFAKANLEKQMDRQVYTDGVHFECSVGYHRLCLEAFLWCNNLAGKISQPFSINYVIKLNNMQSFVSDYMGCYGTAPQIGDNDNGRLFNTGLLPLSNHSYLQHQSPEGTFLLDRFLLDGTASVSMEYSTLPCTSYNSSGFFFLRSKQATLIIRAGVIAYKGTHAHNDQLAFEFALANNEVFVDRGSYQYSVNPISRNIFRSTEAHNTLRLNDNEQNRIPSSVFSFDAESKASATFSSSSTLHAVFEGFIDTPDLTYRHERLFDLNEQGFTILDTVTAAYSLSVLDWYFHLAPSLHATMSDSLVTILRGNEQVCTLSAEFDSDCFTESFPHSSSFGIVQDAVRIHFRCKQNVIAKNNFSFLFRIQWK